MQQKCSWRWGQFFFFLCPLLWSIRTTLQIMPTEMQGIILIKIIFKNQQQINHFNTNVSVHFETAHFLHGLKMVCEMLSRWRGVFGSLFGICGQMLARSRLSARARAFKLQIWTQIWQLFNESSCSSELTHSHWKSNLHFVIPAKALWNCSVQSGDIFHSLPVPQTFFRPPPSFFPPRGRILALWRRPCEEEPD